MDILGIKQGLQNVHNQLFIASCIYHCIYTTYLLQIHISTVLYVPTMLVNNN